MAMSFALRTINMVVYTSGAKLSLFLSILTSVYLGEDIRAERIFAIYAVYNILKLNLLYIFPNAVQKIAEVLVTIDRLQVTELRFFSPFSSQAPTALGSYLIIKDILKFTNRQS